LPTFRSVKRGLTIVLLVLFLLNVLGYYGVFMGLQFVNQKEMRALFDDDNFLPEELKGTVFYYPGSNAREEDIRKKLAGMWKEIYKYDK